MAHISEEMVAVIATLPENIQSDIKEFMEENTNAYIYDKTDVVTAWLTWNGIIGYEDKIISLVRGVFKS